VSTDSQSGQVSRTGAKPRLCGRSGCGRRERACGTCAAMPLVENAERNGKHMKAAKSDGWHSWILGGVAIAMVCAWVLFTFVSPPGPADRWPRMLATIGALGVFVSSAATITAVRREALPEQTWWTTTIVVLGLAATASVGRPKDELGALGTFIGAVAATLVSLRYFLERHETRQRERRQSAYSAAFDQPFRAHSITIPKDPIRFGAERRVQGAGQAGVRVSGWGLRPFWRRREEPRSDRTWELCTSRSQMASAIVGSPRASCQLFVGSCEVMMVEVLP
jgi:hypothetical protein